VPLQVSLGGQPVTNIFTSTGMAADVQSWVDSPASNFGWILQVTGNQASSGRQLASREDATLKPVLTIDYTAPNTPAPPTRPTITGTTLEAGTIQFSFNAESNRTYTVQFRDSLTGSDWSTLTTIPASPTDTLVRITNSLDGKEGFFRVRTP
jgi:hypothetical protein